jgi:hypothetical protein
MSILLWRRAIPCLAVFMSLAGIAAPAKSEAAESQFLVNQWIRQGDDGSIQGKLVLPQADGSALAVNPSQVALMSDTNEAKTAQTDENGAFRFDDIGPGVYTLMTRGPQDVCSFVALHVLSANDQRAQALPQEVELAAGQISFSSIKTMMIRYLPPQQLMSSADKAGVDVNAAMLAPMLANSGTYRIAQVDGGMTGQLYGAGAIGDYLNPSSQTNIFIFHNGEEIQRVVSETSGAFKVPALEPGVYSALIIGASGMGLMGFELVSELGVAAKSGDQGQTLVRFQDEGVATQFVMQVAPVGPAFDAFQGMGPIGGDMIVADQIIGEEVIDSGFGCPTCGGGFAAGGFGGGGFGGGGFGGGGGGGGGGLLGGRGGLGLLAAGGLAAAIVALASDGDDRPAVASPAAP